MAGSNTSPTWEMRYFCVCALGFEATDMPLTRAALVQEREIALVRYFLHQTYEAMLVPDPEGECFPDLKDAEREAILSARQIVGDTLLRGGHPNFGKIQICDEAGTVLKEVSFRAAIFGEADLCEPATG
jgi:hypothetical protein